MKEDGCKTRKRKLKHWNKKTYAGLTLLAALLWLLAAQLPADNTTTHKSTSTAKRTSQTPAKAGTHSAHKAAAHTGQPPSAHHPATQQLSSKTKRAGAPATRHVSSKARRAAADRRRRAHKRPEPERVQEIQQALVQAGYLNAEPNGRWDDQTREAMRRYQADHGFATTGLPEAKSLMKLGLGPHPLPADVDPSSAATPSAGAASQPPSSPQAQQNQPTSAPQP